MWPTFLSSWARRIKDDQSTTPGIQAKASLHFCQNLGRPVPKATNFAERGKQGKTKCVVDVTAAIASAGIAATLITISALIRFCNDFFLDLMCIMTCMGGEALPCLG